MRTYLFQHEHASMEALEGNNVRCIGCNGANLDALLGMRKAGAEQGQCVATAAPTAACILMRCLAEAQHACGAVCMHADVDIPDTQYMQNLDS